MNGGRTELRAEGPEFALRIMTTSDRDLVSGILDSTAITFDLPRWTEKHFIAKYVDGPFGPAITSVALAPDGTVAGAVAFGPSVLAFGREQINGGLSYHTFVHPRFQRRGLFSRLTAMAVDHAGDCGWEILFNFPNSASLPGFISMGWERLDAIRSWIKPLRPLSVLRRLPRGGLRGEFVPDPADERTLFDLSRLETGVVRIGPPWHQAGSLKPVQDAGSLRWRLGLSPFAYRIVHSDGGTAVVRQGKRGGVDEVQVLEFFAVTDGNELVRHLAATAKAELGAEILSVTASAHHPVASVLFKRGFIPARNSVHFCVMPLSSRMKTFATADRWSIAGLDFHMY